MFGRIENGQMILNDAGQMIEKWFCELTNKYPDKTIYEFVVMPNHFHGIVENFDHSDAHVDRNANFNNPDKNIGIALNVDSDAHVGAPLRGRPDHQLINNDHVSANTESPPYGQNNRVFGATLGRAMDWFKTMTTNEYIRGVKNNGWQRFDYKLWQRNYHDHIIRDEQEYYRISEYIRNNPARWEEDRFR